MSALSIPHLAKSMENQNGSVMKRDLEVLAGQNFDLVVIGGGIQGAAVALEACRCGLKTALIEQKDFGHATSANSLKILHGGLRYLQSLDLKRMRSSIRSRNTFMRLAPHLVQPLPCIIPIHGCGLHNRYVMRTGLLVNDLIAWDQNRGIDEDKHLLRGRLLSLREYRSLVPAGSWNEQYQGGALWHDALALDTERMTLAVVLQAVRRGAFAANYCQALELLIAGKRVAGVRVLDSLSGKEFRLFGSIVVNAAGPWLQQGLSSGVWAGMEMRWAKGLNIVTRKKLFSGAAVGLEGNSMQARSLKTCRKSKRFFFFVPWGGYTMIGTVYTRHDGPPEDMSVSREEILSMIDEIHRIYPDAGLEYKDVSFFHAGLLPLDHRHRDGNGIFLQKKTAVFDHGWVAGISGIFSIQSVKYTTAPHVARLVLRMLQSKGNLNIGLKKSGSQLVKTGENGSCDDSAARDWVCGFDSDFLYQRYGTDYVQILKEIEQDSSLSQLVSFDPPVVAAEIVHAIRSEMASTLGDVVFRRTGMGTAGCPPTEALWAAADIQGRELGWSDEQKKMEVKEVIKRYAPLDAPQNS